MKFLFHMQGEAIGGTETQVWHLLGKLRERRNTIFLACPTGSVRDFLTSDVDAVFDPMSSTKGWKQLFKEIKPDLNVTVQGNIFSLAAASRKLDIPVVWLCGYPPFQSQKPILSHLSQTLFDLTVVPSRFVKNCILEHSSQKVAVIPCGVDTHRFKPATERKRKQIRSSLGFGKDSIVLGYAARYAKYKKHVDLVQVLSQLESRIPNCFLLFLGGSFGHEAKKVWDELQAEIEKHKLRSKVVFVRADPHAVPSLYSAIDIFVSPARGEGLGVALLEAMAMQIPVVVMDSGGSIEPLEAANLKSHYAVSNMHECQNVITYLATHPKKRVEIGTQARRAIMNQYNLKNTISKYQDLFQQLVPYHA